MSFSVPSLKALIAIFFALFVAATGVMAAVLNLDTIDEERYRKQLEALNSNASLTEAETLTRDDLNSILKILTQYHQVKDHYDRVAAAVKNSPDTIREYEGKLAKLQKQYEKTRLPDLSKENTRDLTSKREEISRQRDETLTELESNKKKLSSISKIPEYVQKNSQQYQETIHANKRTMAEGNLRQQQETALQAEISYCEYHLHYLQYLNTVSNVLQETVSARIKYYQLKYDQESKLLEHYSQQLEINRKIDIQQESRELEEMITSLTISEMAASETSKFLNSQNQEYIRAIENTNREIETYSSEGKRLKKILEETSRIETEINELIDTPSDSLALSQSMSIRQKSIPDFSTSINAEEQLSSVRLEQYDLNSQEVSARNIDSYVADFRAKEGDRWTREQETAVRELILQQRQLIDWYRKKLEQKVKELENIQNLSYRYKQTKQNISDTINKKIFWLQSNQKINLNWLKNFPERVRKVINDTKAKSYFSTKDFGIKLLKKMPKILIFLGISLLILLRHDYLDEKIKAINNSVGSYRKDRHINTIMAVLLATLRCANWACWSLIIGWILHFLTIKIGDYDIGDVIHTDNLRLAFIILLISITRYSMGPYDIIKPHFGIEMSKRDRVYHIVLLILFALLSVACSSKSLYPHTFATDVIGEVVFMILLAAITAIMLRYCIRSLRSDKSSMIMKVTLMAATAIPAFLIIILFMGYYYSVSKMAERFIDTYFVIVAYLILYFVILRSLSISSRRMEFRRRMAEREQKRKEKLQLQNGSNAASVDIETDGADESMPMAEISNQAQSITRLCMITILLVFIYFLWSDFITILSYLDNITLWTVSSPDPSGKGLLIQKISLGDFMISLYSIFMTLVIVKNMPGLLEILILNRFNSTRRISYSVKTLMTYIIISFGFSFTLYKLGVSWDKLQWLVAALSVGLGFGLQEIFGNFVSGIIILFERPVRIGDVVTINGTTGIVSRIRIRATTIVDFDKKDLIIPNKTFITSQLTNWSLGEECLTRLIIKVGVGYGSNVHQVHDTLMKVAEKNRFVLRTPPFYVVFIGFGDSNLDFQLMVFIEKIKDYYPAIDSLNTEIYNEFNRQNIEIAFNQVDLYIKNTRTGQEIKIDSPRNTDREKAAQAEAKIPAAANAEKQSQEKKGSPQIQSNA